MSSDVEQMLFQQDIWRTPGHPAFLVNLEEAKMPVLLDLEEQLRRDRDMLSIGHTAHPVMEMAMVSELCLAPDRKLMECAFSSRCPSSSPRKV